MTNTNRDRLHNVSLNMTYERREGTTTLSIYDILAAVEAGEPKIVCVIEKYMHLTYLRDMITDIFNMQGCVCRWSKNSLRCVYKGNECLIEFCSTYGKDELFDNIRQKGYSGAVVYID